jgi:gamma-glutamylcyclotransferase (GGCT)/AIG2-like uncharacterized protein YtfP
MAHSLFVYGTLMDDATRRRVTGAELVSVPATLHGYRRYALQGRAYPAIVPEPGATVAGQLLRGLSERALSRLDAYEGREYVRRRVQLTCDDDATVSAWTYVLAGRYRARLAVRDWQAFSAER